MPIGATFGYVPAPRYCVTDDRLFPWESDMPNILERHERREPRIDIFKCGHCGTIFETTADDLIDWRHEQQYNEVDWAYPCPVCGKDVWLAADVLSTADHVAYRRITSERATRAVRTQNEDEKLADALRTFSAPLGMDTSD